MRWKWILLAFVALLAIAACVAPDKFVARMGGTEVLYTGDAKATTPTRIEIVIPPPASSQPATISFTDKTYTPPPPSAGEMANKQAKPLMTWGIVACLLGAAILVFRATPWGAPLLLPTTAGTVPIVVGAAMIAASIFLPQFTIPPWGWLVLIAAVAGVIAFVVVPGWLSNKKMKAKKGVSP